MGILANSASKTMTSSTSDDTSDGYLTYEQVTLSLSVSASTYSWGIASPQASGTAELNSETSATPRFTPDASGYYVVTCLADGTTTYVLRISATSAAVGNSIEVLRHVPKLDASVTAPATGVAVYYSEDNDELVVLFPDGTLKPITLGAAL